MPKNDEPTNISDIRAKYDPQYWYIKLPLTLVDNKNITLTDIRVYTALDFIAGNRGWWHLPQEEIFDQYETRKVAKDLGPLEYNPPSLRSINRAIKRLREENYIVTKRMGIDQHNVLQYYIIARNPKLPPRYERS